MKTLIFLLISFPCLLMAEGPVFRHQDKTINLEFDNVYQDIRNLKGSSYIVRSSSEQDILGGRPFGNHVTGLVISNQSGVTNHILWERVQMVGEDGSLFVNETSGGIITTDASNVGANGRDSGLLTASTFYYVYMISDGEGVAGLYSLSSTSPTMPSGYTYKYLVGAQKTNVSSTFINSAQIGDTVYYLAPILVSTSSTDNGVDVSIDISSAVPTIVSWEAELYGFHFAVYTTAGTGEMALGFSHANVSPTLTTDNFMYHDGSGGGILTQISARNWIPIYNESAVVDATWHAISSSSGLSSYGTYVYVMAYKMRVFN